jgi:dTDP-6-deoxy-L-talose 4-dehydrogenase (NAD+)
MKIAVSGASGFVGRHVLQALSVEQDVRVVAMSRGAPDASWLPEGMAHASIDLESPPSDAFVRLGRPDALIHLAWSGLPNYLSKHHFEIELPRQYAFLRQLVDDGLRTLVCAGTCFEYGMQFGALDESMPVEPTNSYGFAKDALRRELQFLAADQNFALTWARLFYMYGEGQAPNSLYSQFLAASARGDAEFRMSGGEQLRDFLHVSDVARSLVALARKGTAAGIVNVCSGTPTSVRSLVEGWCAAHGVPMKLALGQYPYPTYEPMAFWGRNDKLKQCLEGL